MMSKKIGFAVGMIFLLSIAGIYVIQSAQHKDSFSKNLTILNGEDDDNPDNDELEQKNSIERSRYEWLLTRDPKTGKIPEGIRAKELAWLKTMPIRKNGLFNPVEISRSALGSTSNDIQFLMSDNPYGNAQTGNTFLAAGPTQNGGRTRAVAFDLRYNNTTNKVILAGGVNGGIFRTTDGGLSWKFVHPSFEVRGVSSFAQDPTQPDTWYAGTGEPIGTSASYPSAFVFGNGILKSIDNGLTWSILPSTSVTDPTSFSSPWCFIHKIAVHPITGDVYAAIHRKVVRSSDGGATWTSVFESTSATSGSGGIADVLITKTGSKIFIAMSGRIEDREYAGIFTSATGGNGSFARIAGGIKNASDSVAGWRSYNNATNSVGDYSGGWGRLVIAVAPSNENILYTMVENTENGANKPEADLFKCDMSTTPFTWQKLTDNLVAKRDGKTAKYMELQGGYNMLLAIHPTNPSIVLAGGVNLFRSKDGFATKDSVLFAGGVSSSTYTDASSISHADNHSFSFDPSNPNRVLIGSDGGIAFINDITVTSPEWTNANSQYQTIQYYHIGIDPTPGSRVFYGGAQDNSTTFRDNPKSPIIDKLPDSNDHFILLGGDGCQVGMTKKNTAGQQYLFCSAQEGQFYRMRLFDLSNPNLPSPYTPIKPSTAGKGEFITYYHLDPDNTDYLYYASNDSLFRTNDATKVTDANWTLMKGIAPAINGNIFSMATTAGAYTSSSFLFIGTSLGRIYRLKDPQNISTSNGPTNITPTGLTAGVINDIAINPRNQDTIIAVVSNYNVNSIYWTGNATADRPVWQVIEGNLNLPSVRSCKIVAKSTGIEYYVGTSAGLFSTTAINGTNTIWSREIGIAGEPSEMINTAIVNSLAYRWKDNTLVAGTHGNGMFVAYIGDPIPVITAVTNPIRNDLNFIKTAYPTIAHDELQFQVGNMYTIRKLSIQLTAMNGAVVYRKEAGYENGRIPVNNLAAGNYILTVTSLDRKYQFTRSIIKN